METFFGLVILLFGLSLYFLPYIVAAKRYHHQETAIFMLNLLLGWTFLGWIVALIWAVSATKELKHG